MTQARTWRLALCLMGWGWLAVTGAREASASSSGTVNINVTITQNLSVAVVTTGVDKTTHTIAWNTSIPNDKLVNDGTGGRPSSVTVINDSGGQTERWQLSTNLNSIAQGGGTNWTVAGSTFGASGPAAEKFAMQAVFGSSRTAVNGCPSANDNGWVASTAAVVTDTLETYGDTAIPGGRYVGTSLDGPGGNNGTPQPDASSPNPGEMYAGSQRVLCWRIITPTTTAATATQNIQLRVTAQAP